MFTTVTSSLNLGFGLFLSPDTRSLREQAQGCISWDNDGLSKAVHVH